MNIIHASELEISLENLNLSEREFNERIQLWIKYPTISLSNLKENIAEFSTTLKAGFLSYLEQYYPATDLIYFDLEFDDSVHRYFFPIKEEKILLKMFTELDKYVPLV